MVVLAFVEVKLVPDGTLIIHIALILLMIWILNRTFFRPINKIIEKREKNSGGKSGEAQQILSQVQKKNAAFDAEIRETRNEGYKLIEEKRSEAMSGRQQTVEAVKSEVTSLVTVEKETIARQTAEAQTSITAEAQKMAEKISANILKA
jgi:F-type H+-transporting ATPase subunit b